MDIVEVLKHTSPALFLPDLQATDKAAALAEMVEGLVSGTSIQNPDTILQMLQSREHLGSTAVGPGIAFPHGRTLAVHMYCLLNEGLHRSEAYATAVVLLVMVIGINALSGAAAKRIARRTQ